MPQTALVGLSRPELRELLHPRVDAKLRADQLADWIYKANAQSFDEMSNLPADLRRELASNHVINPLTILRSQPSSDGVLKLLVHAGDNQAFECVLLPYSDRVSCCISTQCGCAMGCEFCATGLSGFDRNLSAGEIVAQYLLLQAFSERRISHVVFMGMGEPLHNYQAVINALRLFHEELGISYRRMTVSTVGLVPQIEKLSNEGLPIHLAVSLHSPIDEIRSKLMPVNHKWPVEQLIAACRRYVSITGRKLTFEYLLIDQVTDTIEQARELARLVSPIPCLVNLIPFNAVDTRLGLRRPSNARIRAFRNELKERGVNVSQRMERGHDIAAACGQLKGSHEGRFARRFASTLHVSP